MKVCTFAYAHHVGDLASAETAEKSPSLENAGIRPTLKKVFDPVPVLADNLVVRKAWKPPRRVYKTEPYAITPRGGNAPISL